MLDKIKKLALKNGDWNNWQWQLENVMTDIRALSQWFPNIDKQLCLSQPKYPMGLTPYYASQIKVANFSDPIFCQAVPQLIEDLDCPELKIDPLHESDHMPVPGIIQRYPDRVVLLTSKCCAGICRHCTRKWTHIYGCQINLEKDLPEIVRYLKQNPQIREVLISGGDPLIMSDDQLDFLLATLSAIESIDLLRIGSRVPVTLPMRITQSLVDIFKKYQPIWFNTHFNHLNEISEDAKRACWLLVENGVPMGNQSVLLRGINDNEKDIEALCRALIKCRVKPYYLFQCDLVPGVNHFRTPLKKGLAIAEYLRKNLSGIAIPTFVIDTPDLGGKIPIATKQVTETKDGKIVFS